MKFNLFAIWFTLGVNSAWNFSSYITGVVLLEFPEPFTLVYFILLVYY